MSIPIDICDDKDGRSEFRSSRRVGSPDVRGGGAIVTVAIEISVFSMNEDFAETVSVSISDGEMISAIYLHLRSVNSGEMLELIIVNDDR